MRKFFAAVVAAVRANPVLVAGAANIIVASVAHWGVHVTAGQLLGVVAVATAILSTLAHNRVTPVKPAPPPEHAAEK